MSINIVQGDLFSPSLTDRRIIVHGCNAQGVMGSGVAKLIKLEYPDAFLDYLKYYETAKKDRMPILGSCIHTQIGNTIIVNAITQQYYGTSNKRYVSYDAVYECLEYTSELSQYAALPVHMPFIGGGLAKGDRDILMAIFEKTLGRFNNTTLFIKD